MVCVSLVWSEAASLPPPPRSCCSPVFPPAVHSPLVWFVFSPPQPVSGPVLTPRLPALTPVPAPLAALPDEHAVSFRSPDLRRADPLLLGRPPHVRGPGLLLEMAVSLQEAWAPRPGGHINTSRPAALRTGLFSGLVRVRGVLMKNGVL